MPQHTLEITGRKGDWYIHDHLGRMEDCGPYTTKEEAQDDMRGLERFWRAWKPSRKPVAEVPAGMLF